MRINTIVLDVQHMGKPHRPDDRGAVSANSDYESDLALKYALCIRTRFMKEGFKTFLMTHGTYQERHVWANTYCDSKTSLYLACHINAGGGSYPLIEHTETAMEQTRAIAKLIAKKFDDLSQDYFSPAQIWKIAKKERGWGCISDTNMSALLLEPLFIDNSYHLEVAKKPWSIATVIFEAVKEFNKCTG